MCDGHFGHVRFKIFVNFDFDGHLVGQCTLRKSGSVGAGWRDIKSVRSHTT